MIIAVNKVESICDQLIVTTLYAPHKNPYMRQLYAFLTLQNATDMRKRSDSENQPCFMIVNGQHWVYDMS